MNGMTQLRGLNNYPEQEASIRELPSTVYIHRTIETYLNLPAASRNSKMLFICSAFGLRPILPKKSLATSESVIGVSPLGSIAESIYCTAFASCLVWAINAPALGSITTLFPICESSNLMLM